MVVSIETEADSHNGVRFVHRLQYWALRAVLTVAARMGPDRLAWCGAALMQRIGPRLRQNRRALTNLAIAFPDKSDRERQQIARQMWANMGRTFAETLVLDQLVNDPSRIEIPDLDQLSGRAAADKPVIGCTLHLGNWEIAILPLKLLGRRPTGVYKPLDNPLIDRWLAQTRLMLYPGGLLGKGDRDEAQAGQRTARKLIDRARSGSALGFVCDHFDRRGECVPFMGRTARFTTAPAMIARHVGAQIWLGRAVRIGTSSRFRLDVVHFDAPKTADKRGDAQALTTAIFATFEKWIRENPEQWMWWNTRWVDPSTAPEQDAATSNSD
ncbi:MAG: lipid A biosynthesis acyltransferase [Hyphomicrobiaceae bacterium]